MLVSQYLQRVQRPVRRGTARKSLREQTEFLDRPLRTEFLRYDFGRPCKARGIKVLKAYPAIDVSVDVGNSATQLQALREGTIDIGLVSGLRNIPDIDVHVVGIDRIMVVVSENHPMADAEVFPLEALEEYSCIMPSPRAPIGGQIARRFEELGIKTNKLMTAVSPAITPGLVQELNCCAILDHLTAAAFSHLSIKIIPLSIDLQFEVQVIESTGSPKRAVTDVYIQSLRKILANITQSSLDLSQK